MSGSHRYAGFFLLSVILPAFVIIIVSGPGLAQVPLRQFDTTLKQMLDAIQTKSYDSFVAIGDARFKGGFTQTKFEELARQIGPRLQQGYSVTFLTTLRQRDYMVLIWKITFKDARDEFLISMAIRDGNVIGFMIR